jgi:hypothetical protein
MNTNPYPQMSNTARSAGNQPPIKRDWCSRNKKKNQSAAINTQE